MNWKAHQAILRHELVGATVTAVTTDPTGQVSLILITKAGEQVTVILAASSADPPSQEREDV